MRAATRLLAWGLVIGAATPMVHAANEFCVSDDTHLGQALVNAQNLPATIKIVQGTYHLDATKWHGPGPYFEPDHTRIADGSRLLGGYTGSDCSGRDIAAGNTILTDDSATANGGTGTVFLGDLLIEGITFRLKQGLSLHNDIYPDQGFTTNPAPQVTIRRSEFEGSIGDSALYIDTYQTTIILENSLIKANTTTGADCVAHISDTSGTTTVLAINNTVVNNNEQGLCLTAAIDTVHSFFYVYNNILYDDNGTADLYSASDNTIIVDNIIGHRQSPALNTAPVGTLSSDPQLTGSYRPTEPTSPAINSGSNDVPDGLPASDLDGGPRIVGSHVDRGAYESSIDDSTVQTVTNTNDSGTGSLRQALIDANSTSGTNSVHFAIGSGCGPHVITVQSALPNITSSVSIRGYTQPGATSNDLDTGDDAALCIILKPNASGLAHAFHVAASAAAGTALTVSGIAFSGFSDAAIELEGGSGHTVTGSQTGGTVGGVTLAPVDIGIDIGPGVSGVTIGGSDDSARNVIGDATASGVHISGPSSSLPGASNNQIVNNYIGVGWDVSSSTFTDQGNGTNGVYVAGDHNNVFSNLIDASGLDGIRLSGDAATNNLLLFNGIGSNFGNAEDGIAFFNAAAQNAVLANTIANNASDGIHVISGQRNELSGNSISGNGGLGIDLATAGVTPNDNDSDPQAPDYANRGLNFPVLARAIGGHHSGTASGTLTSTFGDYTIQFFSSPTCNSSGYGEGAVYQSEASASVTLTANGQGPASFVAALQFPFGFAAGSAITAVAIDSVGNTSEFSACQTYVDDTIFADDFESPPA